jgi:hypothetical protein
MSIEGKEMRRLIMVEVPQYKMLLSPWQAITP